MGYPPLIPKLALSRINRLPRGVVLKEYPNSGVPSSPGWDTNPSSDLWFYSHFESNDATYGVIDEVGGRHLTENEPGAAITYTAGINGNAAGFDEMLDAGSPGNRFESGDGGFAFSDETFSIRCWLKFGAQPDAGTHFFPMVRRYDGTPDGYSLHYGQNDGPEFTIADTGTNNSAQWGSSLAINTWHHIVGVYDYTNDIIKIAVNAGTFKTTAHAAGVEGATANFIVNSIHPTDANNMLTREFKIDELAIWKRALSQNDVSYDYNSGVGRFFPTF